MTLIASDVSVNFGGIQALRDVSLEVVPGSIVALIGPNGAGKTTLVNAVSGFVDPSEGGITVDGRPITGLSPDQRVHAGVGRSFQTPRTDPEATVHDNLMVGHYAHTRSGLFRTVFRTAVYREEERRLRASTAELIERFQLGDVTHVRAKDVPVWQLRLVEVARAMAMAPQYLMLDEPAAGLDETERERLADCIRGLRADGLGVLLVEHNFAFVRELSDRVHVLHQGQTLAEGTAAEVGNDPQVLDVYLGSTDDHGF